MIMAGRLPYTHTMCCFFSSLIFLCSAVFNTNTHTEGDSHARYHNGFGSITVHSECCDCMCACMAAYAFLLLGNAFNTFISVMRAHPHFQCKSQCIYQIIRRFRTCVRKKIRVALIGLHKFKVTFD